MRRLDKIALEKGTDKSSAIHNYCVKYEKWLPFNRLEPITLLEIGVLNGQSLKTWREYYPNAKIIGLDLNPECKNHHDPEHGIHIEIGSQDDPEFLDRVAYDWGPFDLIIDDGSHINRHVIFSFERLIDHVKSEGIYVVEDSCTSYWKEYDGGLRLPNTSIEYFKTLVDEVNFFGEQSLDLPGLAHARREDLLFSRIRQRGEEKLGMSLESINFLNSLIIITKK